MHVVEKINFVNTLINGKFTGKLINLSGDTYLTNNSTEPLQSPKVEASISANVPILIPRLT